MTGEHFRRAMPFGATVTDRETVFRLWAPAQQAVSLVVEGQPPVPMEAEGGGWFEARLPVGHGTPYRFRLDDGSLVPDPASRAQAEGVHGPSLVIDPTAYRWRNPGWMGRPWAETVLYELHAGVCGGFRGVAARLPGLAELGVTAVELMPVADFPGQRNWGYDGVLPFAPDTAYGSPEDLKALVDRAHDLGLMIFLDVVYNHFGPDGNYLAAYAPDFFRHDKATPWGPAIDFRQPQVRRFFTENALYWLMEYRFDGLRLDAVHAIGEPDWLDEMADEVRRAVEPGRRVHLVLEHDGNVASHLAGGFDAQWNDDAHHALHVLLTGETEGYYGDYASAPSKALARVLAEGFAYQGEPSPHRGNALRGTPSGALPPTAFVLFLQNHDQIGNRALGERLTTLADAGAIEAAVVLQLLAPHIPLIFMGEEWGSKAPFLFFTDHGPELADAVREGRRGEFASFAAFSDPQAQARIPDPNDEATFLRSDPAPFDPSDRGQAKRLSLYSRLLAIRREALVPRLDGACALGAEAIGPAAVAARWRLGDGAILTIVANLGEDAVVTAPAAGPLLFESREGAASALAGGLVPARTTVVLLPPVKEEGA
ncbi:malto-oligosyltrehalose trehalohydrolase [Pseudochelatococcus sp. B33]